VRRSTSFCGPNAENPADGSGSKPNVSGAYKRRASGWYQGRSYKPQMSDGHWGPIPPPSATMLDRMKGRLQALRVCASTHCFPNQDPNHRPEPYDEEKSPSLLFLEHLDYGPNYGENHDADQ
jgi:hypothetical protein